MPLTVRVCERGWSGAMAAPTALLSPPFLIPGQAVRRPVSSFPLSSRACSFPTRGKQTVIPGASRPGSVGPPRPVSFPAGPRLLDAPPRPRSGRPPDVTRSRTFQHIPGSGSRPGVANRPKSSRAGILSNTVAGPSLALLWEIAFRTSHINDFDFGRLRDAGYRLKDQMRRVTDRKDGPTSRNPTSRPSTAASSRSRGKSVSLRSTRRVSRRPGGPVRASTVSANTWSHHGGLRDHPAVRHRDPAARK